MKVVIIVVIRVVATQQLDLASASSGFASPLSRRRGGLYRGGASHVVQLSVEMAPSGGMVHYQAAAKN